MTIFL